MGNRIGPSLGTTIDVGIKNFVGGILHTKTKMELNQVTAMQLNVDDLNIAVVGIGSWPSTSSGIIKHFELVGFDTNKLRVQNLCENIDSNNEYSQKIYQTIVASSPVILTKYHLLIFISLQFQPL